jgi:glycosyltransferase involved in cell wall biosynthesis
VPVRPRRPYPVVFLLTSFDVGGTERQMVELLRRLDRTTFDIHLACFHRRGALESRATERIASIAAFPIRGFQRPSTLRHLLAFARWCRRLDARIVHTCELYANIFGLPGAALAGVPFRIGNRRELRTPDKSAAQIACQRVAYKAAHAVVANSIAAARQLESEGVPQGKIRTIPNGVDCSTFRPIGERRGLRRIVTVANLRAEKGHDTLVAAAPRIVRHQPDVEFCIVGDGPERAAIAEQVSARGLGSHFRFLGQRDDVPALLASSDLFVLPSRTEACPNGVLEAMACALPIVATRVGGIPELIEHGTDGLLVDAGAPDALAGALIDLMEGPDRALRLGRAARERAERSFSLDVMVARFEQLYLSRLEADAQTAAARELAA